MYINYFVLEAGIAGFCWYAALWFYPLNLAGIKKVLRNHTTMQTTVWKLGGDDLGGFDKAQLSLLEFMYCGAAWGSSDTDYANVIYGHLNICLKKRWQMALKMHTKRMYVHGRAAVSTGKIRATSLEWGLRSCSQKLQRQHSRSRLQL